MDHQYALLPGFAGHATILRIVGQTKACYRTQGYHLSGSYGRITLTPKGKCLRVVDTIDEALALRAAAQLAYDAFDGKVEEARRELNEAVAARKKAYLAAILGADVETLKSLSEGVAEWADRLMPEEEA